MLTEVKSRPTDNQRQEKKMANFSFPVQELVFGLLTLLQKKWQTNII
jgi:hypothetical protein